MTMAVIFGATEKEKGNENWVKDFAKLLDKVIEDEEQRRAKESD